MEYAVIHLEKHSGSGKTALDRHIDRVHTPPNADPAKAKSNMRSFGKQNADGSFQWRSECAAVKPQESITQRVEKRIKEGYNGKKTIRKDAVRRLDIVLTGSHETMANIEHRGDAAIGEWYKANLRFLLDTYGAKNVVSFVLHRDETTPHIHATIVPLTQDGRLCAKEIVGDKHKLEKLQDAYAEAMKPFGLERGERNSNAHHTDTKEFYRQINAAAETLAANELVPVENEITGANMLNFGSKIVEANKIIGELRAKEARSRQEKNSNILYTQKEIKRLTRLINEQKRHIMPSRYGEPTAAEKIMRFNADRDRKERMKTGQSKSKGIGL